MYNPQDKNFVEIDRKTICLGCNVHEGHEHSCFGEGCECDNAECMYRQGTDLNNNPEYAAFIKKYGMGQ